MGESPFAHIPLIVLEESENIEQLRFVDIQALVGRLLQTLLSLIQCRPQSGIQKATGFRIHVVTTDSTSGKFPEDYITRMFAPVAGIDEDHVCGSANCVMGPYWAAK